MGDVMRNKARAVTAWFGDFAEKTFTYPEYQDFITKKNSVGDMSNFDRLKSRLQCKPFTSYIERFKHYYIDTGLLPEEVFQIREQTTGLCLERLGADGARTGPYRLALMPCTGLEAGTGISEMQAWHPGNRLRKRWGGDVCCSGLMNWNTVKCLHSQGVGLTVRATECQILGYDMFQHFSLDETQGTQQLVWRQGEGCAAPLRESFVDAMLAPGDDCNAHVQTINETHFRVRIAAVGSGKDRCASVVTDTAHSEADSGMKLAFMECDEYNQMQTFARVAVTALHGVQIRASIAHMSMCLDTAGGARVIVYPCYPEESQNMNQVWKIAHEKLSWNPQRPGGKLVRAMCLDQKATQENPTRHMKIATCVSKVGQRFEQYDAHKDGTFLLRDRDSGLCLGRVPGAEVTVAVSMVNCGERQRWKFDSGENLLHVETSMCMLLSNGSDDPFFGNCHSFYGIPLRWEIVESIGWIRRKQEWADNGRLRWFERCLDYRPAVPLDVGLLKCDAARASNVSWERVGVFVPLERKLWQRGQRNQTGSARGLL